jgi:outer membrane protein
MGNRRGRWGWPILILSVAALVLLRGDRGTGAEEKAKVGVLDMDRLFNEYQEYQKANQEYQKYREKLILQARDRLNLRRQHVMLTRDEWEELENLLLKGNTLTDAEKKRFQDLQSITPKLAEELNKLQGKEKLTEAEQARKKELTEKQGAGMRELDERSSESERTIAEKLRERDNEVSPVLRKKIDDMIARIAQENKLDVVLAKESVLYGGLDITEQVVKKLNEDNPVKEEGGEKEEGAGGGR